VNYLPATNSLAQIVTNHPPVAATEFYTNIIGSNLNIAVADLAANWSDMDGDTVSLADVGVSTNGITLQNTGKMLVYSNANSVADQFTCTITDGFGGTNFQNVVIYPALPVDATPLIKSVAASSNGGVTLSLGGASGCTYILEATTNLFLPSVWSAIATNTLGTNGVWQFADLEATNYQWRFYRLELAP